MFDTHQQPINGYIEGYYGKLLSWEQRKTLVSQLSHLQFNTYFYAPKEDPNHRQHWREPYDKSWRMAFTDFCQCAHSQSVQIIAGIAPGLNFNFEHLPGGDDFSALLNKATQLLEDGASIIALMLDDINVNDEAGYGEFESEGYAHAQLANALSTRLGEKIFVVPRAYAKEIEHESPAYAKEFSNAIDVSTGVFLCGSHIVAETINTEDFSSYTQGHAVNVIVWDNLYANDYCPRRLYVGPWVGRGKSQSVMLNPTGMPASDALLLELMALAMQGNNATLNAASYWDTLTKHGVPEEFKFVARYFWHPPFSFDEAALNTALESPLLNQEPALAVELEALEHLLWQWKSPLAMEWYPFLFGLKHDLLSANGLLPIDRVMKTQLTPLAKTIAKTL